MSNLALGPRGRINIGMTTTVQSVADWIGAHTKLQRFSGIGGVVGQPMLQIAANINQVLLARRMPWKWNRVNIGENNPFINPHFIITQQGFQDVKFGGASCFCLVNSTTPGGQLPAGGAGIDLLPGVYQNGISRVSYPTFNPGTAGLVFDPISGQLTVQFLDPHPFQTGNIGTSVVLISGNTNPAFESKFVYNQLIQFSGWQNGYTILAIPDQFHIVLQTNGGQMNGVSAVSASGRITTITLTDPNPIVPYTPPPNPVNPANTTGNGLVAGCVMTFTGVTTNSGLNGQTVTLLSVSATQVTFTTPTGVTIVPGNDTGTIYAANGGAPGIFNFGWLESAAFVDINNPSFPLPVSPIDAVHRISPEYTSTGEKLSISCEIDYGNGVLKFRFSQPISTYPYAFNAVYQAKAPTFTSGESLFQFPDAINYVLHELALFQAFRFAYGSTAEETKMQMEVASMAIVSALESEDREDNFQAITPQITLM